MRSMSQRIISIILLSSLVFALAGNALALEREGDLVIRDSEEPVYAAEPLGTSEIISNTIELPYDSSGYSIIEIINNIVIIQKRSTALYGVVRADGELVTDFIFSSYCLATTKILFNDNSVNKPSYTRANDLLVLISDGIYYVLDTVSSNYSGIGYNSVGDFTDGVAVVSKNGLYGTINVHGQEMVPTSYTSLSVSEGIALAKDDNSTYYFNSKGANILPYGYTAIGAFSDGMAAVSQSGKSGYIDTKGNVIVPAQYNITLNSYKNGYVQLKTSSTVEYADKSGNIVDLTPIISQIATNEGKSLSNYLNYSQFSNAIEDSIIMYFTYGTNKYYMYNLKSSALIPLSNVSAVPFIASTLNYTGGFIVTLANGKQNFIDTNGDILLPEDTAVSTVSFSSITYNTSQEHEDDISHLESKLPYIYTLYDAGTGLRGLYNSTTGKSTGCIYTRVDIKYYGYIVYQDGLAGYINDDFNEVLPCDFSSLSVYATRRNLTSDGFDSPPNHLNYIQATQNGINTLYTITGDEIFTGSSSAPWISWRGNNMFELTRGYSPYSVGVINNSGAMILNQGTDYTSIGQFYNNLAVSKLDDKYGVYNASGQLIVAHDYDSISDFKNGYAVAENATTYPHSVFFLIDQSGDVILTKDNQYGFYSLLTSEEYAIYGAKYSSSIEIYYLSGTIPDFSEPMVFPDGAVVILGNSEDINYNLLYDNYYDRPTNGTYFRILVPGDTYPQTKGFTIAYGGKEFNTTERYNDIYLQIPDDYTGMITISKEGFYTYELSASRLVKSNWITLERMREGTKPVIQAVVCPSQQETYKYNTNLRSNILTVDVNDGKEYEIFVDINWLGKTPGKVWLEQGDNKIEVTNGTTGAVILGTKLKENGGQVYACAQNGEGEITKVPISIRVTEKPKSYNTNELGVLENYEVDSPDNVDFCGGMKLKIDLGGHFPLEIKVNGDGTFEGTVGIEEKGKETLFDHGGYELMKNDIESIVKHGENFNEDLRAVFERLNKRFYGNIPKVKASAVISAELSFIGYLEGRIVNDNGKISLVITDSGFIGEVDGSLKLTGQFGAAYGYFKFAAGCELGISKLENVDQGSLKGTISVTIGIGVGNPSAVGIGSSGTGKIVLETVIPGFSENLDIYTNYSFTVCEISVLGNSLSFFTYKSDNYYWVRQGVSVFSPENSMPLRAADSIEVIEIVRAPSNFTANEKTVQLLALEESEPASTTVFSERNLATANPQIAEASSGEKVIVWIEDDGALNRPIAVNQGAVYFSVFNGENWSEPQIVHQDYTADLAPKLKSVNGSLYLLWMNASRTFSEGENEAAMLSTMDIYYAKYNEATKSFEDISCVHSTGNGTLDMLPDIIEIYGSPTVVWASNTAGDIYSLDGATSLWRSTLTYDNTWEAYQIQSDIGAVDSISASDENYLTVFFSKDTDEDLDTVNDKEIFKYSYGWVEQLTNNDVANTKPQYINGTLIYYSDGKIIAGANSAVLTIDTDRYQYLSGNRGLDAIIYCETGDDFTTQIYAVFNDGSGWGIPIRIAESSGYVTGFSAVMLSDGTINVVVNAVDISNGVAEITLFELTPYCDLELTDSDYYAHSMIDGGALAVCINVDNVGTTAVHYLHVTITDAIESELASVVFVETLLSGDSITLDLLCPLPEGYSGNELFIQVVPLGITDRNETNNHTVLNILRDDVSIEEVGAVTVGEKTIINFVVVNRGLDAIEDVPVHLKLGNVGGNDMAFELVSLAPQEACILEFEIEAVDSETLLYVIADELDTERIISNNSVMTLAQSLDIEDFNIFNTEILYSEEEQTVRVNLAAENNTATAKNYDFIVATYNNGKMTGITGATDAEIDSYSSFTDVLTFSHKYGYPFEVRIFTLDSSTKTPVLDPFIREFTTPESEPSTPENTYSVICNGSDLGITIEDDNQFVIIVLRGDLEEFPEELSAADITYINQASAEDGAVSFENFIPKSIPVSTVFIMGGGLSSPVIVDKLEAVGVSVTGLVRSYDPKNATEIVLYEAGTKNEILRTTIDALASGSGQATQSFVLDGVSSGEYDLVVAKRGHLSYTITGVIVESDDLDLAANTDAMISTITLLCGDITGDGWINSSDISQVVLAANYNKRTIDAGVNAAADLNGDGWVNSSDISIIVLAAHYNKSNVVYQYK